MSVDRNGNWKKEHVGISGVCGTSFYLSSDGYSATCFYDYIMLF